MKVEVEGATIRCYLDDMDKPLITYTDPVPFITGRAGFRAHDSQLRFDNFSVTPKSATPTPIETVPSAQNNTPAPSRLYNLLGQPIDAATAQKQGLYIHVQDGKGRVTVNR